MKSKINNQNIPQSQSKSQSAAKNKRKVGRPVKTIETMNLPPDWKDTIYVMSSQGCSEIEIRAFFLMRKGKFCQYTWDALKERDAEFSLTIKQCKVLCEAWWQKVARKSLFDSNFQAANWYMNMKNRFGWRDKHEVDHGISDSYFEKYSNMTVKQLEARYKEIGCN